jgi:hypothetical protein
MIDDRTQCAIDLMHRFALRTGKERRYLWTDAFAVMNYLGLARATRDQTFVERAVELIGSVHSTLGRSRVEGRLNGWLGGRSESDARAHPTAAGLRIGKPLAERGEDESFDERLEWDRDGQYFHYLTKWMQALAQTAHATGDESYLVWARELAEAAHRAFVYTIPDGSQRMYWKMSVDLSRARPLVRSMGQHDPLDGYVTYLQLATPALEHAVADFKGMIDTTRLATDDPLGIGGLLVNGYHLEQLGEISHLLQATLVAALAGLTHFVDGPELKAPTAQRLAFRELGLSIGLAAVAHMMIDAPPVLRPVVDELDRFMTLANALEAFWLRPENQATDAWRDHVDINEVMLATTLVPEGHVSLLNRTRQPSTAR